MAGAQNNALHFMCIYDKSHLLASGGFFPGPPVPPSPEPPPLDTCMGDLFSVAWMENAEAVDLTAETLQVWLRVYGSEKRY